MRTADPGLPYVRRFCRSISLERPVLLPIAPSRDAVRLDCFNNVRRKVARDGGRIIAGWAIWEWPGVYIEAENHAVYEPRPGRRWLDITPAQAPHLGRRLFLPDAAANHDFSSGSVCRENRRQALVDDPIVQQLFSAARRYYEIRKAIGPGKATPGTAFLLRAAELDCSRITKELALKYAA
jgi:hypothetical protein